MKFIVTMFILCASTVICDAQITITSDDFLSGFSQLGSTNVTSYSISSLSGSGVGQVAKQTGAGISWDFSPFSFTQQTTASFEVLPYPSGAPLASDPDFATATHVIKVASSNPGGKTIYEFVKINSTGMYNLGSSSDTLGGQKLYSYNPPLQQYQFPLTYQTSWTSNSSWNQTIVPGATVIDSTVVTVDGYGSLITPTVAHGKNGASPMGVTNDALRMTTKKTNSETFGAFSLSTVTYSYEWITKANHRVSAVADNNQKLTSITYSAGTSSSSVDEDLSPEEMLNLHLSNNPVSNSDTKLLFTMHNGGNAQVSMMDALGQNIRILQNGYAQPGQNILPIDPATLSAGTYFLRVNAEGMFATQKLIITK